MLTENLALLFERDILKLKVEINAYRNETTLWINANGINNSGGNLCLHLLGNLQYYIGSVLGHSGYVRNRPEEFSQKNIPVIEMNKTIDQTIGIITNAIRTIPAGILENDYPEKVLENTMTIEYFLLHLLAHLNYHLGQINYHRRLLDV